MLRAFAGLVLLWWVFDKPAFALQSVNDASIFSHKADTIIAVKGKAIDEVTGEPVAATILYEKLPYYDDVGMAKSDAEGAFIVYLLSNTSYAIQLKAEGYEPLSEEFTIFPKAGALEINREFVLAPDKAHQMIVLENLIFERGRSRISSSSFEELDKLVSWLNERPNMIIQLEGHTDFEGNANANIDLSQERVEAVKKYLTSKGIKKARVQTKAFGGSQPLTMERTDEGKRKNRRVEVRVIKE